MLANAKFFFVKVGLLVIILCSSQFTYGQDKNYGTINYLENNGDVNKPVRISVTKHLGKTNEITVNIGDKIYNGSYIKVKKNTRVEIISPNGNDLIIKPTENDKTIQYFVDKKSENYYIKDENSETKPSVLIKVWKQLTGGVHLYNPDGSQDSAAKNTQWEIWSNGPNMHTKYRQGKVALNYRYKIEMEDSIVNFQDSKKRILYLTQIVEDSVQFLSPKDTLYDYNPEHLEKPALISEENIDKFFIDELRKQSRFLRSSGPQSKLGFKSLSLGDLKNGIELYEKAIDSGEITIERFIQASLILTEAYHEKDVKKNIANAGFQKKKNDKEIWLEASLHFTRKVDSIRKKAYDFYSHDTLDGDYKDITKYIAQDLILAKEYLAWAYTVKLKLNGCLENMAQNPKFILQKADELKTKLGL